MELVNLVLIITLEGHNRNVGPGQHILNLVNANPLICIATKKQLFDYNTSLR